MSLRKGLATNFSDNEVQALTGSSVVPPEDSFTKTAVKRNRRPESGAGAAALPAKVTKKRKVKANENDMTPLASRTTISSLKRSMYIGAHVSAAGGMHSLPGIVYNKL